MTGTEQANGPCRIVAGENHLQASVGSNEICAEVERAIAARAPNASYSVEVKILSPSRLAAVLVVNGRALPEHKFAVMDAELSTASTQRFARSLAAAVAAVAKP